jgi:hypothetical protein
MHLNFAGSMPAYTCVMQLSHQQLVLRCVSVLVQLLLDGLLVEGWTAGTAQARQAPALQS